VRRVSLDEAIMGTDYSVEDIIPRELETSEYERTADADLDGVPCFVVEVRPKAEAGSQYSKLRSWIEKAHYVPIRTDYWDLDGNAIKRFTAPAAEIEEVEAVWLIRQGTMANLVESSSTRLEVLEIEPNAKIRDSQFSTRTLEKKGR
jgi:outer membrane lipoprotein-sorting protein